MTQNDDQLVPARDVSEFADEVNNANEWVKARSLVGGHPFNILATNERDNTYRGKTTREYVFEIQWTAGDMKGARANMSLTADQSRARVFAAVKKYGPHGPYWMKRLEKGSGPTATTYYKLVTSDPALDDATDEQNDDELPF